MLSLFFWPRIRLLFPDCLSGRGRVSECAQYEAFVGSCLLRTYKLVGLLYPTRRGYKAGDAYWICHFLGYLRFNRHDEQIQKNFLLYAHIDNFNLSRSGKLFCLLGPQGWTAEASFFFLSPFGRFRACFVRSGVNGAGHVGRLSLFSRLCPNIGRCSSSSTATHNVPKGLRRPYIKDEENFFSTDKHFLAPRPFNIRLSSLTLLLVHISSINGKELLNRADDV